MTDYTARRTAMVDCQIRPADVTKFPVIAAMLAVPREKFLPAAKRPVAYLGEHVALGGGRVLPEARITAKLLDGLDLQPTEMVLLVGAGTGYSAALLSRLAEAVVALEEDAEMAAKAERELGQQGADNVAVITGALAAGAAAHGPYDAILIEGGVETVPQTLIAQLNEGGRIAAVHCDGPLGRAMFGRKHADHVDWKFAFNATVPVLPGFARDRAFAL